MKKLLMLITAAALSAGMPAAAADYRVDKDHTSIGFSVKHMVISNVKGYFKDYSGGFSFDEKTKTLSKADLTIKAATINSEVADRDADLRSERFLNAEKFPNITFALKKSELLGGDAMRVVGNLTIRGVTKEVVLEGEYLGSAKDPKGNRRVGFTAAGKIKRGDFGLKWNQLLETGGVLVGEEVKILIEVEGVLKP
ncbi:MAG: polyisoprenoid-binding protein [Nitrospinae bacterium]|nr:polyisoprenoid-binding protein [Nitrospinota bacterium]